MANANLRKGFASSMGVVLPPTTENVGQENNVRVWRTLAQWILRQRSDTKKIRDCGGLEMLSVCGDRSIGEANLRKGLCPFKGGGTAASPKWSR